MSKEITSMHTKAGRLQLTQYWGGKGACIQLTQGIGGQNTPGYVQLTQDETMSLIDRLNHWLRGMELENEDTT